MEKEGLQNNEYENQYDLPVNKVYVEKIKEFRENIKIRHSSKWLNAVSVSFSESPTNELENILRGISEFSFVSSIDVVDRYKKENVEEDTQRKEEEEEINDTKMNKRETMAIDYGTSYTQLELSNVIEAHKRGLNGTGVTVIILDSGFDKSHPSISPLKIIAEHDFLNNDDNTQSIPADAQNVHGTACLSNLGGWAPGFVIGSGFGASFILAKTENTNSETIAEEDTFIAAVEWGESLGADVLSASLGYSNWYTFMERNGSISPVSITCDRASKLGMTIVVAAGNAGSSGITTPGDAYDVISVGAVSKGGNVAGFSSLGPSADGRIKPEISAHGVENVIATTPDSNTTTVPLYGKRSGTSFACPIVAGAVAILLQAHPDWTPSMVKESLQMTASSTNSPNFGVGWGIIDIIAAINYVPVSGDCTTHGCSSKGCCVNSQCQCAPGYYGKFCNFERVECVSFCNMRSGGVGECLKLPTGISYRCSDPEYRITKDLTPIPSCPGCVTDTCGVCFGFNDTCCDTSVDVCGVCGGNGLSCGATTSTTDNSSVSSLFPSNFLSLFIIILVFVFTNK